MKNEDLGFEPRAEHPVLDELAGRGQGLARRKVLGHARHHSPILVRARQMTV
ncbi:hypothetical protein A2U01_0043915 [Trifolium medium]|uniref:Uncharacterized protein n=1 Tax=Trifolium medium TaxID=97028 RepID=A0A392QFN9_9FABA|nr:hypothetical protein [Trifolium medium]